MNEIIKVNYDNDTPRISGRELHGFMEVTERYSNWIERMTQYGFEENIDYSGCKVFNTLAHQELQDHQLSIEMAKEISMLQRNEKGKQARQYFIQLEKAWNTPEQVMARALKLADQQIRLLQQTVQDQRPKVLFADAVESSHTSILIGDLAKLMKQNGKEIGQNRLFEKLRKDGYLCSYGDKYNSPSQRSMELKLFEVRERTVSNPDGSVRITKTTKVTGKGQIYFINKYCHGEA